MPLATESSHWLNFPYAFYHIKIKIWQLHTIESIILDPRSQNKVFETYRWEDFEWEMVYMSITKKQIFQNCRVLKRGLVPYIYNPRTQERKQEDHLKSQPQQHWEFKASQDHKKSYLKEHKTDSNSLKRKDIREKYTLNQRSLNIIYKIGGQRKAINVIVLFEIISLLV